MRIGIYPGTFDPVTFGHVDVITRAMRVVDRLIIGVAVDSVKTPLFTVEQRVAMVEEGVASLVEQGNDIVVQGFEGLLIDFAKNHDATILVRGLRAASDFEYEFQMAGMNSRLNPELQTIFLPASEHTHFIASRFVKEIARLGGDIQEFVSPEVAGKLAAKFH